MDPRNYQIVALSGFIVFGVSKLGFQIEPANAFAIVCTSLFVQYCLFTPAAIPGSKPSIGDHVSQLVNQSKSALISSLSLVLLLRTDLVVVAGFTALVAIASKRFIRFNGNHFFNPSACALVLVTMLSSHAYISPGQWGALGFAAFAVCGVGLLVVTRAQRLDVAMAFLLSFAGLVFLRGWYLGDPIAIAFHQLQNGALLLFTFFMITDPKTTPVNLYARVIFGVSVSALTAILQFKFYLSAAPIYALVALAPMVPFFNCYLNYCSRKTNHVKENANHSSISHSARA